MRLLHVTLGLYAQLLQQVLFTHDLLAEKNVCVKSVCVKALSGSV